MGVKPRNADHFYARIRKETEAQWLSAPMAPPLFLFRQPNGKLSPHFLTERETVLQHTWDQFVGILTDKGKTTASGFAVLRDQEDLLRTQLQGLNESLAASERDWTFRKAARDHLFEQATSEGLDKRLDQSLPSEIGPGFEGAERWSIEGWKTPGRTTPATDQQTAEDSFPALWDTNDYVYLVPRTRLPTSYKRFLRKDGVVFDPKTTWEEVVNQAQTQFSWYDTPRTPLDRTSKWVAFRLNVLRNVLGHALLYGSVLTLSKEAARRAARNRPGPDPYWSDEEIVVVAAEIREEKGKDLSAYRVAQIAIDDYNAPYTHDTLRKKISALDREWHSAD